MSIAKNTLKNAINDIDVEQYRKDMQKTIKHWVFWDLVFYDFIPFVFVFILIIILYCIYKQKYYQILTTLNPRPTSP